MSGFASGKNAYGISDRSGVRYKLNRMKKEWNGSLVGPDEFEPKHPQLYPPPRADDPQAIRNARPDRIEPMVVNVGLPHLFEKTFTPIKASGQIGSVTVSTT